MRTCAHRAQALHPFARELGANAFICKCAVEPIALRLASAVDALPAQQVFGASVSLPGSRRSLECFRRLRGPALAGATSSLWKGEAEHASISHLVESAILPGSADQHLAIDGRDSLKRRIDVFFLPFSLAEDPVAVGEGSFSFASCSGCSCSGSVSVSRLCAFFSAPIRSLCVRLDCEEQLQIFDLPSYWWPRSELESTFS